MKIEDRRYLNRRHLKDNDDVIDDCYEAREAHEAHWRAH